MADESAASEGFESAMRFGSSGPTLYDYVLVSIPYTEGTSSASGLDESGDVDLAIPIFYDDDWNVIWDTSDNGSDASNLAGNYSHYSERESEWDILMSDTTCVTDVDEFNVTNPCYIDTSEDRIWIRLPHFSGTEPAVSGDAVVATGGSSPGGSGGGSGGDRRLDSLEQEEVEDELVVVDEILDGEKIDSEVSTVQEEVKPLDRPIALRWVFAIMLGTILVFIIIIWILKAK